MKVRPLIVAGWAALLTLLVAAIFLLHSRDDSLERVREAGVLRVGYAIEAPFAMLGPGGRVTGESPETARRIAERLGVPRIEWVQLPFQSLILDLRERRIDMVAAGLFITPERAARVRFSNPTVCVLPGVLVRRGNPKRVAVFESLAPHQGYRVAVVAGTVEEARLQRRGWTLEDLTIVPDGQVGRAVLAQGVADGLVLTVPTLRWIARSAPDDYEVLVSPNAPASSRSDFVAFAFHPDDAALQRAWNEAQAGFIGSKEHLQIVAPFGFEAEDLADDVRASEVLRR